MARVAAVPAILDVVARATGMRFSAVARVTETTWTACAVYDTIDFGLRPGGEPVPETTICNEIRQHRQPVVFGQVRPPCAKNSSPSSATIRAARCRPFASAPKPRAPHRSIRAPATW